MEKKKLLGMTLNELKDVCTEVGMPQFAARQMAQWMYGRQVANIDDMTNLSLRHRAALSVSYTIGCVPPVDVQKSVDGTCKYLFPTENGQLVECVYIPDGDRATLCVSCQAGCRMGCHFCMTGRQHFQGSLSVADILNQVYSVPDHDKLTNIVFMGQGEPMDNLDAVLRATRMLTSADGWAWSPKRITVSTVGVARQVETFLRESECHLAVSLHNPFPDERLQMMPAEKTCSITDLLDMLSQHDWSHQRRLSFEYIVFGGLNDTERHARELVRLLTPIECRVNLIRFHTIPDSPYHGADESKMVWLRDYLTHRGVTTTIRASRGQDIYAACGLLHAKKNETEQN